MVSICNDAVHAVVTAGLAVGARLEAGDLVDWNSDRTNLERLLAALTGEADAYDPRDEQVFSEHASPDERRRLTQATIRLAVACWLDEWFTQYTPLASRWRSADRFGPIDGDAKFWDEARYAETRGDLEALATMHLCVMLGFRGAWRDRPAHLEAWATRIAGKLAQPALPWTPPVCLELPRRDVMLGEDLPYRRMAFSVLLTLALLLPVTLILFWRA